MPFRDVVSGCLQSDFPYTVRSCAQPVPVAGPHGLLVVGLADRIARHSVSFHGRGERLFVVANARTWQEMRRRTTAAAECFQRSARKNTGRWEQIGRNEVGRLSGTSESPHHIFEILSARLNRDGTMAKLSLGNLMSIFSAFACPDLLRSCSGIFAIQYCSNAGQQIVFVKRLFENRRV